MLLLLLPLHTKAFGRPNDIMYTFPRGPATPHTHLLPRPTLVQLEWGSSGEGVEYITELHTHTHSGWSGRDGTEEGLVEITNFTSANSPLALLPIDFA